MALGSAFIQAHIEHWEARLAQGYYNYRGQWPSRLFHHAPLQNIAEILASGALLSRIESEAVRKLDVAGGAVVNCRLRAHNFARLYFRPRTPTQFHIEGIRKSDEYYRGVTHSPTLAMMVFSAADILRVPGVRFSDGNMQSGSTTDGDTEEFFGGIDFAKVYHEGGISGDYSIITARCAEVLAPSPLSIEDYLQAVFCRSQSERQFLLHLLGGRAQEWEERIRVSDDLRLFENKYTYVERVSLSGEGLLFRLSPRSDGRKIAVQVHVHDSRGSRIIDFEHAGLEPAPVLPSKNWILKASIPPGEYNVEIWLEGCTAYQAVLIQDDLPF